MELNCELIQKIIDWLDAGAPHEDGEGFGFNMDHFFLTSPSAYDYQGLPCGTAMCIAGAAHQFSGSKVEVNNVGFYKSHTLLGISKESGDKLFYARENDWDEPGSCLPIELDEITPKQASRVLKNLLKTGEVDWSVAMENDNA